MEPSQDVGPVLVRPVIAADLPTIVAMRDDLNDLERAGCPHAPISRMTLEQFTARWGSTLHDPRCCWRIVEIDGRPAGYGLIYLTTPPTQPPGAFIHWAYLVPAYRQLGLGRLLLDHLLAWARGQGVKHVELQFIEGNEMAEAFWTRMGFRPYARKCVRYLEEPA